MHVICGRVQLHERWSHSCRIAPSSDDLLSRRWDKLAHLVTDKVVVALQYSGAVLLVLLTLSVVAAIGWTKGADDLLVAVKAAGIAFGLPAVGVYALAHWVEGRAAILEGHPGERRVIPKDSPARHPFRSSAAGYLVAVIATLGAWGLRAALDPYLPGAPFVIFFLAIMIAGWYGGHGPALLSIALGAFVARFYYMEPIHTFPLLDTPSAVRFGSFLFVGLIVGGLTAALRAALQRVQHLADRLSALEGGAPLVSSRKAGVPSQGARETP